METPFYKQVMQSVFKELHKSKSLIATLFIIISFLVLLTGYVMPKQYVTSSLVYADTTNLLEPLLKGKGVSDGAGLGSASDRAEMVYESLFTRRLLERIVFESGLANENSMPDVVDRLIKKVRKNTSIKPEENAKNFFRVLYVGSSPDRSFEVHNTMIDVFLTDVADRKRNESRNAYQFIDEQVKSYQRQLQDAERRLKEFNAENKYGTPQAVSSRIEKLRAEIEGLQIQIDEQGARAASIQGQLTSEGQYLAKRSKVDALNERLMVMQKELDTMRLSYQESYPDIVSLKGQIDELKRDIAAMDGANQSYEGGGDVTNPYYQELKKRLAESQVEQRSLIKRKAVLAGLLEEEYGRAERVAEKGAEFTELTRDYDVTRGVYEDMLKRKESARISMSMNIEGAGVVYKIQEPATFPKKPSGLQFWHMALLGPFLGILIPIGILVAYVILDPRVRFPSQLVDILPQSVPMLGAVDHYNTPVAKRLIRADMLAYGGLVIISLGLYIGLVVLIVNGAL